MPPPISTSDPVQTGLCPALLFSFLFLCMGLYLLFSNLTSSSPRYIRRLIPMLAEHVMQATERHGLMIQTTLWTKNNCRSINNVLKSYTSWKPLKLPELVPTLEEADNAQYRETRRAIIGLGNFELSEQFKKLFIQKDALYGKTDKQRKDDMKKFFRAVAESEIVRATKRSIKTARAPKHGGKKPCQRRRHRSERTQ